MSDTQPNLPANARIDTLTFEDGGRELAVTLRGGSAPQRVAAESVKGLFGARIRHESATLVTAGGGISFGKLAVTAATGIPVGITKGRPKQQQVVGEELHHAVAMRLAGAAESWYLLAASFNFRKALGAEAGYSTDLNLRAFVKRLATFANEATRDPYIAAIVGGNPLPPPLDSLLEFLKAASM
jgi:hypothetical protein